MKITTLILLTLILTACSGGNSSSGSQQRYQGSEEFISAMSQAEKRYKAGRVSAIVEGGTSSLAGYDRKHNSILFGPAWTGYEIDDLAGILAHENTHARQPASKSHEHAVDKELEAYAAQVKFLQSIGRHDLAGIWASQDGTHVCDKW